MSKGFGAKQPEKSNKIYLNLLKKSLKAASKYNFSPKDIYYLLRKNHKKIDALFVQTVRDWTKNILSNQDSSQAQQTGICLLIINHVLIDFRAGNYQNCVEIEIAIYEAALTVLTYSQYPQAWADAQINLGNTYLQRIVGDKIENYHKAIFHLKKGQKNYSREHHKTQWADIQRCVATAYCQLLRYDNNENKVENAEQAIHYFTEALEVYNRKSFPLEWAKSLQCLGNTYYYRIQGEKINNIEKAIQYCQQSLQVYNREQFPQDWMTTKFILAVAYSELSTGNRAENIERAILLYKEGLQMCDRTTSVFDWAKTQYNLGKIYLERIQGDRGENIEISIQHLIQALEIYESQAFLQELADTRSVLGDAYLERFEGDKADNIEQAIDCFEKVLLLRTGDFDPEKCANTQYKLASVYWRRIRGNKSNNIERAIYHCQQALSLINRALDPEKWADVQRRLGNCYLDRIKENNSDNIERAIDCFTEALQVYNRDCFPTKWAEIQIDLSCAYSDLIRGQRSNNIEQAIFFCDRALQIYTKDLFPEGWTDILINLSGNYIKRLEGDKSENIEQAIYYLNEVLSMKTCDRYPEKWASVKINLGMAYAERIKGDSEENADLSIKFTKEALSVCARSSSPMQWTKAYNTLGTSYLNRQKDDPAENIEQAIYYFTEGLSDLDTSHCPYDWAIAHHNLGFAYAERIRGDRKKNCEQAIQHYEQALQVFTPKAFPKNCLSSGLLIGYLAFDSQLWERAIIGCKAAIDASETLRNWEHSELARQIFDEQLTLVGVYQIIVESCIKTGRIDKALEYVERSRSKRLVDLMASNDLYGDAEIPQDVRESLQQYESLQQQIDNLRSNNESNGDRGILNTSNYTRAALESELAAITNLEAQKQEIWQQIRQLDPVLAGEIQVDALNIAQMQQLIKCSTTAILSFFTTNTETYVFVLRQDGITLHTCNGQGLNTLQNWLNEEWSTSYSKDNSQWRDRLNSTLAQLAQRLQIDRLVEKHLDGIEELIIIPHLLLHQIPLAAIPVENGYLCDRFLIRYIPSCQILEFCQQRQGIETLTYGTVEDAEGNLPYASFEGEQIARLFQIPREKRLQGSQEATCKNYRQLIEKVQSIHCCHHAESRLDNPLESRLKLADGSITLGQLMTPGWRLPNLSDVFLACCETGLGKPSLSDDLFTLSTGFLCAGARTVVSSLWRVDDLATALLSIFYYQQIKQGKDRSHALQQAQIQLRQLKKEDLRAIATPIQNRKKELIKERKKYLSGSTERSQWEHQYKTYDKMTRLIESFLNEESPFSNPRYWAAFICQGLRKLY